MLKHYALRLLTATATTACVSRECLGVSVSCPCLCVCLVCLYTVLCGALYTACVDASRTVFWDRSRIYERNITPTPLCDENLIRNI